MSVLRFVVLLIRAFFCGRAELAVENLALRQQLAILERCSKRPRLRKRERIFWVWLSRVWAKWCSVLVIVQPDVELNPFRVLSRPRLGGMLKYYHQAAA